MGSILRRTRRDIVRRRASEAAVLAGRKIKAPGKFARFMFRELWAKASYVPWHPRKVDARRKAMEIHGLAKRLGVSRG